MSTYFLWTQGLIHFDRKYTDYNKQARCYWHLLQWWLVIPKRQVVTVVWSRLHSRRPSKKQIRRSGHVGLVQSDSMKGVVVTLTGNRDTQFKKILDDTIPIWRSGTRVPSMKNPTMMPQWKLGPNLTKNNSVCLPMSKAPTCQCANIGLKMGLV